MEILDPGCNERLLDSKLAEDDIRQERYSKLREFVESIDGQPGSHDPRNDFLDLLEDEAEAGDDEIEVYMQVFIV